MILLTVVLVMILTVVAIGNNGNDTINAGLGNDQVYYSHDYTRVNTIDGGDGLDLLYHRGTLGNMNVNLASQDDAYINFENLHGSQNNDILTGDHQNNEIMGWGGNDIITGGAGADTLLGGAGADKFVFGLGTSTSGRVASNEDGSADSVKDFTLGQDKIQFTDNDGIKSFKGVGTNGEANTLSALFSASDASGKISAKLIEGATDNQYTKLEIKIDDGTDTNTITLEYSSAQSSFSGITHDGDSTGNGSVQLGTFAQFLTALGGANQVEIG